MPKLLRCTSPQAVNGSILASWTNYLNDGIELKEFSKVGVSSMIFPIDTKYIIIDATNSRFSFKFAAAANVLYKTIALPYGRYSVTSFLAAINQAIVDTQTFTVAPVNLNEIGVQVQFLFNSGYFSISYNRTPEVNMANLTSNDVTTVGNISFNGGGAFVLGEAFAYSNKPMIQACGYVRGQIVNTDSLNLGLITDGIAPFTADKLEYFIGTFDDAGTPRYQFYDRDNDAIVNSGFTAVANDYMSVEINVGYVRYVVYRGANPNQLPVYSFTHTATKYDIKLNYLPIVVLNVATADTLLPLYTPNTTFNQTSEGDIIMRENTNILYIASEDYNMLGLGALPRPSTATPHCLLRFATPELQDILGFSARDYTIQIRTQTIKADNAFGTITMQKGVLLECPSFLTLESFDSTRHGRRPLLALIQGSIITTKALTYSTPNPIMLDLNNKNPILLRNLMFNVYIDIDEGEELLNCNDQIEIILIFE